MAGELAYDPGTGQLVYNPDTGQLALNCDDVEYSESDCEFCTGGQTPKYFTVTLSGIDAGVYVGCLECFIATSFNDTSVAIDGVHLLTETGVDPHSCRWSATVGSWSWTLWSNEIDCTGFSIAQSGTCKIFLTRTEAGWELAIGINSFFPENIFTDTVAETGDDDCINVAAMANQNGAPFCEGGEYDIVSDTGSATFEAGDQT